MKARWLWITLLGGILAAQEVPTPALNPDDFELLPLNDLERSKLLRQERPRINEAQALAKRITSQEKDLAAARAKNDAETAGKLETELSAARRERARLIDAMVAAMRPAGVTDAVLTLVAAAPAAPYRVERYARALVLQAPGLDGSRRALVERIVGDVNAAALANHAQRRRLELTAKQASVGDEQLGALLRTFDQQRAQTDRRFWHLIDYVLTDDERYAVRELLPTRYARIDNGPEHLYLVPGIEPRQTTQLRALITELEAESAPEQALRRRNTELLRDRSLPAEEQRALRAASDAAQQRLESLQEDVVAAVKEVLTEAQWRSYAAIPPLVSPNDRRQRGKQLLEGIDLSAQQHALYAELEADYKAIGEKIQTEMREVQRGAGDAGADGPQMELMQMQQTAITARALVHQRQGIGRLFVEILTPDQVSAWVLGATAR